MIILSVFTKGCHSKKALKQLLSHFNFGKRNGSKFRKSSAKHFKSWPPIQRAGTCRLLFCYFSRSIGYILAILAYVIHNSKRRTRDFHISAAVLWFPRIPIRKNSITPAGVPSHFTNHYRVPNKKKRGGRGPLPLHLSSKSRHHKNASFWWCLLLFYRCTP